MDVAAITIAQLVVRQIRAVDAALLSRSEVTELGVELNSVDRSAPAA